MEGNSEVISPPPYLTAHLPSYDEILQLQSSMLLQLDREQNSQESTVNREREYSWTPLANQTTAHSGNTSSLPAPPAYDDVVGGNLSTQQPAGVNVQQNQTHINVIEPDEEELQQRIERRMMAIDEEIRQRQTQRTTETSRTTYQRTNRSRQHGSPDAHRVIIPDQDISQSSQPQHNTVQHLSVIPQSSMNVQQNRAHQMNRIESDEELQQRIERRMATIDEEIRQRRDRKTHTNHHHRVFSWFTK